MTGASTALSVNFQGYISLCRQGVAEQHALTVLTGQNCLRHAGLYRKGDITATILIGEVVLAHVLEAVTTKTGHGHIIVDIDKYAPVSRLGGDSYARVTELYDIPRPGKEWQARASAVKKA